MPGTGAVASTTTVRVATTVRPPGSTPRTRSACVPVVSIGRKGEAQADHALSSAGQEVALPGRSAEASKAIDGTRGSTAAVGATVMPKECQARPRRGQPLLACSTTAGLPIDPPGPTATVPCVVEEPDPTKAGPGASGRQASPVTRGPRDEVVVGPAPVRPVTASRPSAVTYATCRPSGETVASFAFSVPGQEAEGAAVGTAGTV